MVSHQQLTAVFPSAATKRVSLLCCRHLLEKFQVQLVRTVMAVFHGHVMSSSRGGQAKSNCTSVHMPSITISNTVTVVSPQHYATLGLQHLRSVEDVVDFNFGIGPGVKETSSNMNLFNDKSATSE
jgi:hypothetical protein